jgi:transmembrane protein EpsG
MMLAPYVLVILISMALTSGVTSTQSSPNNDPANKQPKLAVFFVGSTALFLTLVSAFRWRVGTDYWSYERLYTSYIKEPMSDLTVFSEPGIRVLAKIGAHINELLGDAPDPALMFALAAFVTVPLMVWTIYKSTNIFTLAILLFILSATWQGTFNGVRQYIACAILFWGHRYILSRRLFRYAIVVFIALLFHASAAVMLLAYWIPRRSLKPHELLVLVVSTIVAIMSYSSLLDIINLVKTDELTTTGYFARQINPLRIAISFAPIAVYLLFTVKSELKDRDFLYLNMIFLNTALLVASLNSAYLARFSIYTGIYACVLIPNLINMKDANTRKLAVLLVVTGYAIFWILETRQQPELIYRTVFSRPT